MYYAGRIWYNVGSGIANSYAKSIILDAFPRYKARKKKNLIGGLLFMSELKTCSRCKRELPLDGVHFYRDKNNKDGFNYSCKECEGHVFSWPIPSAAEGHKKCTKCNRELLADRFHFYIKKQSRDGLGSWCKECAGGKIFSS